MPRTIAGIKLYDAEELAQLTGVTIRTIREYCKTGKLRGKKFGRRWYIPEDAIMFFFWNEDMESEDVENEKIRNK